MIVWTIVVVGGGRVGTARIVGGVGGIVMTGNGSIVIVCGMHIRRIASNGLTPVWIHIGTTNTITMTIRSIRCTIGCRRSIRIPIGPCGCIIGIVGIGSGGGL